MVTSPLGRRELGRFSNPIALVSGSGHQAQSSRRWAHSQLNLSSVHFSARLNAYREIRILLLDVTVSKETSMGQRQPEPANQNEKLNAVTYGYLFLGETGTGKSRNAMGLPSTLTMCSDKDSNLRRLESAKVFMVS